MHLGVVEFIIIALLQTVCRVRQLKNFENRLIIGEDMGKSPCFYGPPCSRVCL